MKDILKHHNSSTELCVEKRTNRHLNLQSKEFIEYLNGLKRFSRYLIDCHGIILDCSARINGNTEHKRMWLTNEEIESLYYSCRNGASGDMDRAIFSVFYGLGLRRSEGVALDIDDIQVPNGVVYVLPRRVEHFVLFHTW